MSSPLDSQLHIHAETYAYTHPYFPLYYDLWTRHLFGPSPPESTPLYTRLLNSAIARHPTGAPTILDIGTGTGAVIKDLSAALPSFVGAFWGIDHSQSMLDRARATYSGSAKVEWRVASATSLPLELRDRVDLAIFAAGGVGHLVLEEELAGFLREVQRVLKEDGRAVVSVLKDLEDDMWMEQKDLVLEGEGATYVKTPTVGEWDAERKVKTERFTVERREGTKTVWSGEARWSLRTFDEGLWRELVEKCGMKVEEVVCGEIQDWWVLVSP